MMRRWLILAVMAIVCLGGGCAHRPFWRHLDLRQAAVDFGYAAGGETTTQRDIRREREALQDNRRPYDFGQ